MSNMSCWRSLKKCKDELSVVIDSYQQKAIFSLRRALSLNWKSENGQVKEIARRWALCFPDELSDALSDNESKGLSVPYAYAVSIGC